jgi:hypothetical protein
MLVDHGEELRESTDALLATMMDLSITFTELYEGAVEEEYDTGRYKDINHDKSLIWHEYRNGKWASDYISLIDILSRMAALTSAVAHNGVAASDEMLTIYRNGVSEALISFNQTV